MKPSGADSDRLRWTPVAWLLGLSVLGLYLVQWQLEDGELARLQSALALSPARARVAWSAEGFAFSRLTDGVLPLFTHGLLPAGILHAAGNMFALFAFGSRLEARAGSLRLLSFAVLASVGAGIVAVLTEPDCRRLHAGASVLGAAVIAALLVLHPRARLRWLVPVVVLPVVVRVPAAAVAVLWLALQFEQAQLLLARGNLAPVPVAATAAGFGLGVLLAPMFWSRRRPHPQPRRVSRVPAR